MDFEEWFNGHRYSDIPLCYGAAKDAFKACQQSKQEEVNKLKKEIDELKKRTDKALELLNEFNCPPEYGVEDVWKAASILTGENNE